MRIHAMICLMALAGCAGTRSETKPDGQVTKTDGVKADTSPQVDAAAPGSDWLLKRDAQAYENGPLAPVLLLNPAPKVQATVAVTLVPTTGKPKEMATLQRANLRKMGVTCSQVTVSKDGRMAGFTTVFKMVTGKMRKGKTFYLSSKDRKDYTVAVYAAWNPQSDKAMLAATDKIAASITVK